MSSVELKTLVLASKDGDQKAFGDIVQRLARLVTGVAYSVCGDFDRSEDVGQEAFLEAWKNLSTLKDAKKFTAWICTIARRRAIDNVRRSASRPTMALETDPLERSELSPETIMENKQKRELVWSLLQELPETYRETMILYYRSEQSVAEVATALGTTEPTIRQRLKRGREMLRVEFADLVSDTIRSTVPKAAFATAVMAALPASTYAAGAAGAMGTTTAAGKAGIGGAAATAAGAAALGSLIGLIGGIFGAWNSWRNAKYKSQQRFIIRQTVYYLFGTVMFLAAIGLLIYAKQNGMVTNGGYRTAHLLLTATALGTSMFWIWFFITGLRRLETKAVESGEKRRPEVAAKLDQFQKEAQTVREDGSIGYEVFRWNVHAWFGSALGGSIWMIISAVVLAVNGDFAASTVTAFCFAVASILALAMWKSRERMNARRALNWLIVILAGLTAVVLASFQFLTGPDSKTALSWHPACWFLMLLFPAMLLKFHFMQRGTEKMLLEKDKQIESSRASEAGQ